MPKDFFDWDTEAPHDDNARTEGESDFFDEGPGEAPASGGPPPPGPVRVSFEPAPGCASSVEYRALAADSPSPAAGTDAGTAPPPGGESAATAAPASPGA